jgi:hypothetical protein
MAYNWNVSEPKNDQKPKFEIQPEIYSIIELNGENRTYTCDFRPNKVEKYFEAKIDRNSIDSLVKGVDLLSKEYKSVIHYDSNIGCIKPLPVAFPKNRTVLNSNLLILNFNCHNEEKQFYREPNFKGFKGKSARNFC